MALLKIHAQIGISNKFSIGQAVSPVYLKGFLLRSLLSFIISKILGSSSVGIPAYFNFRFYLS
jgi:hypothetical protein